MFASKPTISHECTHSCRVVMHVFSELASQMEQATNNELNLGLNFSKIIACCSHLTITEMYGILRHHHKKEHFLKNKHAKGCLYESPTFTLVNITINGRLIHINESQSNKINHECTLNQIIQQFGTKSDNPSTELTSTDSAATNRITVKLDVASESVRQMECPWSRYIIEKIPTKLFPNDKLFDKYGVQPTDIEWNEFDHAWELYKLYTNCDEYIKAPYAFERLLMRYMNPLSDVLCRTLCEHTFQHVVDVVTATNQEKCKQIINYNESDKNSDYQSALLIENVAEMLLKYESKMSIQYGKNIAPYLNMLLPNKLLCSSSRKYAEMMCNFIQNQRLNDANLVLEKTICEVSQSLEIGRDKNRRVSFDINKRRLNIFSILLLNFTFGDFSLNKILYLLNKCTDNSSFKWGCYNFKEIIQMYARCFLANLVNKHFGKHETDALCAVIGDTIGKLDSRPFCYSYWAIKRMIEDNTFGTIWSQISKIDLFWIQFLVGRIENKIVDDFCQIQHNINFKYIVEKIMKRKLVIIIHENDGRIPRSSAKRVVKVGVMKRFFFFKQYYGRTLALLNYNQIEANHGVFAVTLYDINICDYNPNYNIEAPVINDVGGDQTRKYPRLLYNLSTNKWCSQCGKVHIKLKRLRRRIIKDQEFFCSKKCLKKYYIASK